MTICIARRLLIAVAIVACTAWLFAVESPVTNGVPQLLNAQSALNTAVVIGPGTMSRCRETVVYIQWSAGTSAGAIQVETAHDPNYAGAWAEVGSPVAWSAATKEDRINIAGVFAAVRTRISTAVVGGTVSTWILCN